MTDHENSKPEAAADQARDKAELRPIDCWNCGNGHLPSQVALTLIKTLGVTDYSAMQWLADTAYEAGPQFCEQLLRPEMPF